MIVSPVLRRWRCVVVTVIVPAVLVELRPLAADGLGRESSSARGESDLAAAPFLLSFIVSMLLVRESMAVNKAVWDWSEDHWYLGKASLIMDLLHASGWNFVEAWSQLTALPGGASWTLAGWPYLLGVVSALVTSDPSPEIIHAIALSLNATFLTLVLAFIFHLLDGPARRFPNVVLAYFLLLIADPIVYAALSRKEAMLHLALMLVFAFSVKLAHPIKVHWIALGILGIAGVLTSRPAYVPLLLLLMYWMLMDRFKASLAQKIVIALILLALLGGLILNAPIRGRTIAQRVSGRTLEAEPGLAMSVYNIPVIGPVLYYAIAPPPPLPWNLLSQRRVLTSSIRGLGSMAWVFAACFVLWGIIRNRRLLNDRLFVAAAIMFVGLFAAVVLTAGDPRFKQPTNFYLTIMLFLTWHHKRGVEQSSAIDDLEGGDEISRT